VDAMLEKARLEQDIEKGRALVFDLQRYLAKTMYALNNVGAATGLTVAWPCVRNFRVFRGGHNSQNYRLWLDQSQPPFKAA
jgi:hypothetical protein